MEGVGCRGGGEKRAARVVSLFWLKIASCNIGLQLLDLCTHDGVDLVVLEDIYLTVAEEFLSWVGRVDIYLWGGGFHF